MSDVTQFRRFMGAYSLLGIPAARWWRLLRENQFAVDPAFSHRAAVHSLTSLLNSALSRREARVYGTAIARTQVTEAPIFILGHHRSGTTHLHNLLALDDAQLAYPNTCQVIFPFTFLRGEAAQSALMAHLLPAQRPMDNMAVDPHHPQEDEFALSLLSSCSPYLWFIFPRHYDRYCPYISFENVPAEEVGRWQRALLSFAKKLTLRYGRRLVFKSPFHTARIRLIRQIFPNACFIHICRDPYTVFQSCRHMFQRLPWTMCLQDPSATFTDERIIGQYTAVYDRFFQDKAGIPADRFHEMHFEALERDPLGEMRLVYEKLGLHGFSAVEPKLRRYLDSIATYRKNSLPALPAPMQKRLAQAWHQSFEAWGYPT